MSSCMTLPGFDNPVHDTQRNFRTILQAMSRPCLPVPFPVLLPALPDNGKGGVGQGLLSVALTLCDGNTPIWLDSHLDTPEIRHHLRFHCSSPLTGNPQEAAFAFISSPLDMPRLYEFACGEPAYPERSTTLVIDTSACGKASSAELAARSGMSGMSATPAVSGLTGRDELNGESGGYAKQGKCAGVGMAGIPGVTATITGPGVKEISEVKENREMDGGGADVDTDQNRGASSMLSRMPDWFLRDWRANYAMYPLGVDVLFVHTAVDSHGAHTSLLGLPRSSCIQYSA